MALSPSKVLTKSKSTDKKEVKGRRKSVMLDFIAKHKKAGKR